MAIVELLSLDEGMEGQNIKTQAGEMSHIECIEIFKSFHKTFVLKG